MSQQLKVIAMSSYDHDQKFLPMWERYYKSQGCDLYTFHEEQMAVESANVLAKEKITHFLKDYDWVIVSSLDEYIVPNPFFYLSIKDYISKNKGELFTTTGYEYKNKELTRAELYDKVSIVSRMPKYTVSNHAKYTLDAPPRDPHLYLFHYKYIEWNTQ